MDDDKQDVTTKETNTGITEKPKEETREKKDAKSKAEPKKSWQSTFNEFKGEFKKIIWPTRKELGKKTVIVIITSLLFGLLIFCIDSIYNVGVQLFVQLVTK